MPPTPSRSALAGVLAGLAALVSLEVSAQTTAMLAKSDFAFSLEYYDVEQRSWTQMTPTQQAFFFNRARCECNGDTTGYSGYFRIAIQPGPDTAERIQVMLSANSGGNGSARLYAGNNVVSCLTPTSAIIGTYSSFCLNLVEPNDVNAGIEGGMATIATTRLWHSAPIPVAWLFNAAKYPVCSGSACDAITSCASAPASVTIYFWAQTSSRELPDRNDLSFDVNLAGQSSFVPEDVTAEVGDKSLTVHWGWPNGLSPAGNTGFLGVQVFCARSQNAPVFNLGSFAASFMTSAMICPDAAPAPSQQLAFDHLAPVYLCSGLLPAATTNHRIAGLQDGITYAVGVAGVDRYGNLSPITAADVVYGSPVASVGGQGGGVVGGQGGEQGNDVHLAHGCSCAAGGRRDRRWARGGLGLLGLGMLMLSRRRPVR